MARKAVSEAIAANLTRQLFADRQSLLNELPGVATLEKPDTDKDASVPVHPGAAAYIDGTEQTFVEKYSDYFWGALLLFSGIGSAGAWFRAFIKRDEKAKHLLLRGRLLDLIAGMRTAPSIDALERMESEVDDIVRETLIFHEDGAIEDGQLAAFNLVLDQFRFAAAERRRAPARCVTSQSHSAVMPANASARSAAAPNAMGGRAKRRRSSNGYGGRRLVRRVGQDVPYLPVSRTPARA